MSFSVQKIFLVALITVITHKGHSLDMTCKGQPITMTEKQINNIKGCAKAMGAEDPMKLMKEKVGCFSKCIMEKKMLVDENGKPHKENINKLIDSTMPKIVRADAKNKMGACLDEHGAKINISDATCMSYVPLAQCTRKAMMDICK